MSLDKHSFGDGAALTWDVPALRPLPARRSGNVEPDALQLPSLLLSSSAYPMSQLEMRCAPDPDPFTLAQLATVHTRNSLHHSGLAQTLPAAQS